MDLLILDKPKSWRLIERQEREKQGEAVEEMIFVIRGVLCAKDLPPITEKRG